MTPTNNPNSNNDGIEHENGFTNDVNGDDTDIPLGNEIGDNNLSKAQRRIVWRRNAVFWCMIQGVSNSHELSRILHVSPSTCLRDIKYWKQESANELRYHISERLPMQFKISVEGINEIIRVAWSLILDDNSKQNKIALLALLANAYKDVLEITTNRSIITEALNHVEKMKQEILGLDSSNKQSAQREQEQ